MKKSIPYKYRVRVGQDPPEEPQKEQPKEEKLNKSILFEKLQNSGPVLAYAFTIGLAMALSQAGLQTKEDLKGVKPQDLAGGIANLLKLVLANKRGAVQELRLVWRYGPQKYLQRKGAELRSL